MSAVRVVIAEHRPLQDVPPYDEQAMQKVGIEELPSLVAPFLERVVAYQLVDVEILLDLG